MRERCASYPSRLPKGESMADSIISVINPSNTWDEESLRSKIYIIRGVQVMLDTDLAEVYGYSVRAFNQQVKRNAERFEGEDFMFRLTDGELAYLRSQNVTANINPMSRSNPHVFTEQGIYMLMTVLKGELAVEQSRMLVRLFKSMKDYIAESRVLVSEVEFWKLKAQVSEHSAVLARVDSIEKSMLTRADLPAFMQLFDRGLQTEEVLILDGEPLKADVAYAEIYGRSKASIVVVDDYIGLKTLQHVAHASAGVRVTVVSDNRARPPLTAGEYRDFCVENPGREITFVCSEGRVHDRYIALDLGTPDARIYHCGASSKDAGRRITTITRLADAVSHAAIIEALLENPPLMRG